MEFKCPNCKEPFLVHNYAQIKENLFTLTCYGCKELYAVKPGNIVCRIIPVLPDFSKEIQPIDYEKQLTSFDYELASVARIKL